MPDPVKQPSVLDCCGAAVGAVRGVVRPRRPDRRLLESIIDAGLPEARGTVSIRALPQVSRTIPTAVAVEGAFTPRQVGNALTSFVIEHPQARFVVEPGVCHDVEERAIAELPAVLRTVMHPRPRPVPTVTALQQEGIGTLDFALPTHAHWDHVSGLLDLPGLPVYLHRVEHQWISFGQVAPAGGVRAALRNRSIAEFDLDGPPVLTFSASHDLFGDGTVVLVDLAGHTPGSIGILAQTWSGGVLLAGDAAWHSLQVEKIRQKASFPANSSITTGRRRSGRCTVCIWPVARSPWCRPMITKRSSRFATISWQLRRRDRLSLDECLEDVVGTDLGQRGERPGERYLRVGSVRGEEPDRHPGSVGTGGARDRVLEGDAVPRVHAEPVGGQKVGLRMWFGFGHICRGDDGTEYSGRLRDQVSTQGSVVGDQGARDACGGDAGEQLTRPGQPRHPGADLFGDEFHRMIDDLVEGARDAAVGQDRRPPGHRLTGGGAEVLVGPGDSGALCEPSLSDLPLRFAIDQRAVQVEQRAAGQGR